MNLDGKIEVDGMPYAVRYNPEAVRPEYEAIVGTMLVRARTLVTLMHKIRAARPRVEPSIGSVIRWTKGFGPGKQYSYAALHAANGTWYTTARQAGRDALVWDELLTFIGSAPIQIVANWLPLDSERQW